jgi:hypothetical protein
MSWSEDFPDEQVRIINALYNAWVARPTGIGLHEEELSKQARLALNDLVKEVLRLKSKGIVATGHGSDNDQLGRIWLTDFGRSIREDA